MAIGNCPRCGAQTDDENDLCYQCALRRIHDSLMSQADYFYDHPCRDVFAQSDGQAEGEHNANETV